MLIHSLLKKKIANSNFLSFLLFLFWRFHQQVTITILPVDHKMNKEIIGLTVLLID